MKKHFYIAILLFLFPVFLCTCHKKEDGKTEDQIPPVEVVRPEVGAVTLSETLPGTLQSSDKVEIVCRVNGKLTAKHVEPGQRVSKGQLLYSMNPHSTAMPWSVRPPRSIPPAANMNMP